MIDYETFVAKNNAIKECMQMPLMIGSTVGALVDGISKENEIDMRNKLYSEFNDAYLTINIDEGTVISSSTKGILGKTSVKYAEYLEYIKDTLKD